MEEDLIIDILSNLLLSLLLIVPLWKTYKKSGLNPKHSLISFVPIIGILWALAILALSDWPNIKKQDEGEG